MSKSRIDPVQDAFGNVAYRVQRIFPTYASAQVGAFALGEIDPADLEPPTEPNPGTEQPNPGIDDSGEPYPSDATAEWIGPPNCDGLNCAEVLTERTAGDD